ncbi:YceI family protein [Empedobacter falsenii]|uniref:YceI family protein n=1 Tax=Empedobacter TaxID=59734 RepID=UPI00056F72A3|nr:MULTISPECIES: YceI family protein [Empedobacter]MDH2206695.1 YceI family protein [Empedobacter sp. GD03644]MDM1297142.1 YceI family protein [Empedobacter falsenii]MDM1316935.1 YceI family protein [Empedobacter falsenii]
MATKWNLDPSHSEVQFKVKHMVISTVTGNFDHFNAGVESNSNDFSDAKFEFDAKIESINTKNSDRDGHLKSADFFAAEQFPEMKFESTSGIQNGKIEGTLEIRGEKKPITLNADFGGVITDPWGLERAGFEFSGEINRKDYGLGWSQVTEAGGLVVSDKVKLLVNLEFTQAQ